MKVRFRGTSISNIAVRSFSELTAIIVGILIALAVNDWWGNHNDRVEEQKILASIHEDVNATLQLIKNTQSRVEVDLEKLRILSTGSSGVAGQYSDEQMASLLHSLWDVPPLTLQMSTHKELQTSGRLRLITDAKLRHSLAHFQQKYDFAVQTYLDAFQNQQLKLDEYLLGNVQLSQITNYALEHDAGDKPAEITPLAPLKDHHPLLDDFLFQNQVAAKFFLLTYYLQQTQELTDTLNELDKKIISLISH